MPLAEVANIKTADDPNLTGTDASFNKKLGGFLFQMCECLEENRLIDVVQ